MRWPWSWDRDPASLPDVPAPDPAPRPLPEEDELLGVGPIELGQRAETLLADPLLRAGFARVRADIQTLWLTSKADEVQQRERYHQMLVAVDAVESKLKGYIRQKRVVEERRKAEDQGDPWRRRPAA